MTRQEMMDEVVRLYGFENKLTVWFFECAEVMTDEQLLNAFILLDAAAYHAPEDDEEYDLECGFDPYEGCYTYDC